MYFSTLVPNPQLRTLDKNIQALLPSKIKVVLPLKGTTETAYRNSCFCNPKIQFFSSRYHSHLPNFCSLSTASQYIIP